jgi:peroxiredoxin
MLWTLIVAGIYNLVWGAVVVLFPNQPFHWLGMQPPNYPELWQCIGMIVGVYGVGYWIAAHDPARHWPIVLVGWLGKVLGPIGFLSAALAGKLPWAFGLVNITNDLIWWLPFTAILYYAWRTNSAPGDAPPLSLKEAFDDVRSQRGRTIGELSATGGVLLLFIRHAGCTFCREALAELAAARQPLEAKGLKLAVAHMSAVDTASALLARYGLDGVDHFSDPDCRLFRAFNLARGSFWQVLGPAVWFRGLPALLRHGIGKIDGDGFQLGGAFLIRNGKVVAVQRLATSAERADLSALLKAA